MSNEDLSIAARREKRRISFSPSLNETYLTKYSTDRDDTSFESSLARRAKKVRRNAPRDGKKNFKYQSSSEEEEYDLSESSSDNEDSVRSKNYNKKESDSSDEDGIETIIGVHKNQTKGKRFYVKWKNQSYKHCSWMTEEEMVLIDGGANMMRRYLSKLSQEDLSKSGSIQDLMTLEGYDVNEKWLKVDRIIDDADENDGTKSYLVKWTALDYCDSTWESEADIEDKDAIAKYLKRLEHSNPKRFPSRWERPSPDSFQTIKESPKSKNDWELRDYQLEGMNWLRFCWYNRTNSILADEMGLGKTVQIVTTLKSLREKENLPGPYIIVAPMSTLPHWKIEFERWTDLNVVVYHGNLASRQLIMNTEFVVIDDRGRSVPNRVQFDVIITNFETLVLEFSLFSSIDWSYLVIDEAHRIKNHNTKIYQTLCLVSYDHCTLLTGTPIQNGTEELWTLLHFICQDRFPDRDSFMAKYGDMKNSEQVSDLHRLLKPIMLRRKKSDVEKGLAAKEETIIEVELTRVQKKFYKALLHKNASVLLKQITSGSVPSLLNLMMQLRKVCNHPYLIKGAEETILEEKKTNLSKSQLKNLPLISLCESSGKMVLIDKLLPKLKEGDHKVLIFSQMVKVLDIIEEYLELKNYSYERIDGSTYENSRADSIDRFNKDPNLFVFLLSTKAGGVGINLTAADVVIIYDSDWNPQNDIQAQARCHRIGQKSKVQVYRLITRGTYESEMFERASKKLALDHIVLDGKDYESDGGDLNGKEIEKILRNGIYSILKEDDTETDNFCSQDIDQILERRSKVFTKDIIAGGESKFSKAQFKSETDTIDLDAADFWSQILPNIREEDLLDKKSEDFTIRQCRIAKNEIASKISKEMIKPKSQRIAKTMMITGIKEGSPIELSIIMMCCEFTKLDINNKNLCICQQILTKHPIMSIQKDSIKEALKPVLSTIKKNCDTIILKCGFIYRLQRVLQHLQNPGFDWPVLPTKWESPYYDYSLMLCVYKYGIRDPTSPTDDKMFDHLLKAKPLTQKNVEARLNSIIQYYENSISSENEISFNKIKLMSPSEWLDKFPETMNRSILSSHEAKTIIEFIILRGIPISATSFTPDFVYIQETLHLTEVSLKAVSVFVQSVISINKDKDSLNDPSLSYAKALFKDTTLKSIQKSIMSYARIHEFVVTYDLKKLGSLPSFPYPASYPKWWNNKFDIGLIKGLSMFGNSPLKDWILDKALPFKEHISPKELQSLHFLKKEESRVSRAIGFIDFAELNGNNQFPISISEFLEIIQLGNEQQIGYQAKRLFKSVWNPEIDIWYSMSIEPNSIFRIVAGKGRQSLDYQAESPQHVWNLVYSEIRQKQKNVRELDGNWMFGLTHPRVRKLLHK